MILQEIKQYIQAQPSVSLQDLCLKFQSQPSAMRGMLSKWVSKGKLKEVELISPCSGCGDACQEDKRAFVYQWQGPAGS